MMLEIKLYRRRRRQTKKICVSVSVSKYYLNKSSWYRKFIFYLNDNFWNFVKTIISIAHGIKKIITNKLNVIKIRKCSVVNYVMTVCIYEYKFVTVERKY